MIDVYLKSASKEAKLTVHPLVRINTIHKKIYKRAYISTLIRKRNNLRIQFQTKLLALRAYHHSILDSQSTSRAWLHLPHMWECTPLWGKPMTLSMRTGQNENRNLVTFDNLKKTLD